MANASRRREAIDEAGRVPDTSKGFPEEPAPREHPDHDEPGWDVWFGTSLLCFPAALLGGLIVTVGHGLVLGVVAGILGIVIG